MVISRDPLTELMPLQRATNSDALMTQYEMHGVEALGLLKFDFLGLSNLTILRQAVDLIERHKGVRIDLDHIPLDDATTFELLSSGETTGVFQLESAGMRRYIKELRPTSVYDLAAMVALFRPGPMDNIPSYIRRKHGQEKVTYLHPLLKPYLEKTYGIFVYQEDIMAAAMALGGFTGPEADTLGYAIRKKKSSVLRAQKDKFVRQAAERGVDAHVIDAVFKAFEPFERYGFNKAHATCYGLIAYQTAYLKANYPVEYMTSVLSAFRDNTEKVAGAIAECRRLGIEVLGPDVRHSHLDFTVEGDAIRFGLLAIKNVGEGAIQSIIDAREEGGEFRSLADLCARIDLRLVNKRVLESLIKVDALRSLGHPAQLLDGLDDAMAHGQAKARDRETGQGSLFDTFAADEGSLERPLPVRTEAPSRERLRWEKELLGLYLSDHPLGELAAEMARYVDAWSADVGEPLDQQRVVVGGMAVGIRRVITRNRESMAVVTLEDLQGTVDVVVFPRTYAETGDTWREDSVLLVAGRVDHKGDETVVLADTVWTWDDAVALGPEAFAQAVAAGDRGRRGPRRSGNGRPNGRPSGGPSGQHGSPNGQPSTDAAPATLESLVIPRVSPLRGSQPEGTLVVTIGSPARGRPAAVADDARRGRPRCHRHHRMCLPGAACRSGRQSRSPDGWSPRPSPSWPRTATKSLRCPTMSARPSSRRPRPRPQPPRPDPGRCCTSASAMLPTSASWRPSASCASSSSHARGRRPWCCTSRPAPAARTRCASAWASPMTPSCWPRCAGASETCWSCAWPDAARRRRRQSRTSQPTLAGSGTAWLRRTTTSPSSASRTLADSTCTPGKCCCSVASTSELSERPPATGMTNSAPPDTEATPDRPPSSSRPLVRRATPSFSDASASTALPPLFATNWPAMPSGDSARPCTPMEVPFSEVASPCTPMPLAELAEPRRPTPSPLPAIFTCSAGPFDDSSRVGFVALVLSPTRSGSPFLAAVTEASPRTPRTLAMSAVPPVRSTSRREDGVSGEAACPGAGSG